MIKILFVCHGNICRSPMAEFIMKDLVQKAGLAGSRSEARRNIEQGGVEAGGEKVTDVAKRYTEAELSGDGLIIRRGKKKFARIRMK